MPNILGKVISARANFDSEISGAFYRISQKNSYGTGMSNNMGGFGFDASSSNSVYGNASTVIPDCVNISCIIYLGK